MSSAGAETFVRRSTPQLSRRGMLEVLEPYSGQALADAEAMERIVTGAGMSLVELVHAAPGLP
ncbi:hypothetical protein [Streptomyces parvulus]|uniref:hypothetical protein n=1 Tax=Streptomyces parvulus TaxID=146923 RepID=UPI00344365CE